VTVLNRYRDPLVALLLLLVPLVFYISNAKRTRDHNWFDRGVVTVSAPVQWLTVSLLDSITRAWTHYVYLVDVREANDELAKENAGLKAELVRREEERLENERLRLLLRLREHAPAVNMLTARVVATSPTPLFRSVRIDVGSTSGVTLGAAVVTYQGVVGRVAAVTSNYADVMLLVDANSSVDVLVQRSRARARVRGRGSDADLGIVVEYLGRTEEVEPGDVLISSGTGTIFPKGLPVGTVTVVERGAFGLYQRATIEPTVDFRRLEEVLVIPARWQLESSYEELQAAESEPASAPLVPPSAVLPTTGELPPPLPALLPAGAPAPQVTP